MNSIYTGHFLKVLLALWLAVGGTLRASDADCLLRVDRSDRTPISHSGELCQVAPLVAVQKARLSQGLEVRKALPTSESGPIICKQGLPADALDLPLPNSLVLPIRGPPA